MSLFVGQEHKMPMVRRNVLVEEAAVDAVFSVSSCSRCRASAASRSARSLCTITSAHGSITRVITEGTVMQSMNWRHLLELTAMAYRASVFLLLLLPSTLCLLCSSLRLLCFCQPSKEYNSKEAVVWSDVVPLEHLVVVDALQLAPRLHAQPLLVAPLPVSAPLGAGQLLA